MSMLAQTAFRRCFLLRCSSKMGSGMRLVRLTGSHVFKPFDCGDEDLNEFLLLDSKDYLRRLVSVTYLIETDERTVAFFSVSNDRIAISDTDKAAWRKIRALFPHAKHRRDYPAVKIGPAVHL